MEYDNDRPRKRPPKSEIFYWILLVLLQPVSNAVMLPAGDASTWILPLLVSLMVFPGFIIYSRIMGQTLQTPGRPWYPFVLPPLSYLVILAFVLAIHSLFLKFPLSMAARFYFSMHAANIIRDCWWTAANMALAVGIFYIRKADDEEDQLLEAKKDTTFFQLRYLRAQLNPHFLFNTLNSIYSLSLQKSEHTPEVVVKLADIMRYLIYECNEDKIPLDKEIEFIRNYIEIEKIRYKADIRFNVEGITTGVMIEPFLFISFVENGFKHAMDHSFGEPFIFVTLRVANGQVVLNVLNSSNADLEVQAKRLDGRSIAHSRSMLELLYPASYDLDIIQTEKDESRTSELRLRNARERLESLYPDSHTLDVILNKSTFTVSLILKTVAPC
jgi:two-component system, LytTR family, sensor kinase